MIKVSGVTVEMLKPMLSTVEIKGIYEFLKSYFNDAEIEKFIDLEYNSKGDYAKLEWNFEVNEGFYLNETEMIDHLALTTDEEIILVTTTENEELAVYRLEL